VRVRYVLPIAITLGAFLQACPSERPSTTAGDASHASEIDRLRKEIAEKDRLIALQSEYAADATQTIIALQERFAKSASIAQSAGLPTGDDLRTRQLTTDRKEQLLRDLDRLHSSFQEQAGLISAYREREKRYGSKIADLESVIATFETTVRAKEAEVARFREAITNMQVEVQRLRDAGEEDERAIARQRVTIDEKEQQVESLRNALRRGYVVIKPMAELIRLGIMTDRRIWFSHVRSLSAQLDPAKFAIVDTESEREFEIEAPLSRVEIVSRHPAGSYRMLPVNANTTRLTVLDTDKFWAMKYLVVAIR
jgi:hypothetical protein